MEEDSRLIFFHNEWRYCAYL